MILKKIKLKDFRNYKKLELEFNPKNNIFFGYNASGKTNLLDAIYFLAFLKSWRSPKDEKSIRWGEAGFYLKGEVEREKGLLQEVEISTYREGAKKLKINSKAKNRFPCAGEGLKVVTFYPDDFLIISSTPLSRRRFLNLEISQVDATYRSLLRKYQKIVTNRNIVLKRIKYKKCNLKELPPWDDQLINLGSKITKRRTILIEELLPIAERIHNTLTDSREYLKFKYVNSIDKFGQSLDSIREKEIAFGMTLIGPHRDDIIFLINNVDASIFASRAQQRTLSISIRLALSELLKNILGEPPVVLMDDVLSELDEKRKAVLVDFLQSHNMQCFITTTDAEEFRGKLKQADFFEVNDGSVDGVGY